jgi:deoxycytidylate deaminase
VKVTLIGDAAADVLKHFEEAAVVARESLCWRDKCGAIVVSGGNILGDGFNGPPHNLESQRRCDWVRTSQLKPKSDTTCCVHAEWRAVIEASADYPGLLGDARLYFMRVTADGAMTFAGDPYCTPCSRLILDAGIAEVCLLQATGPTVWSAESYNQASYDFFSRSDARP